MKQLINQFAAYIRDALGFSVSPEAWDEADVLPLYLQERYAFFRVELLGVPCILAAGTDDREQTPAAIEKQFTQLAITTNEQFIYLRETITGYDRKRLIERKIPFIIPGNQMYLPFLGVHLREYFREKLRKFDFFNPSTQHFLLYFLQQKDFFEINPQKAAELLKYSNMTMSRVFKELEKADIGQHKKYGKEKIFHLGNSQKAIWDRALPYLQTPVQKKIYVREREKKDFVHSSFILAGQSALARMSMIAEPKTPVYAIQGKLWMRKVKQEFAELPYPDLDAIELELWSYPVLLDKQSATVDKLSLYLSLRDGADERLQSALEEMMKGVLW